jgi:hypothetical protein
VKKLLALIIALTMPINSFAAECSVPVKFLEEGSPAPCRGYLFSQEKELQVRIMAKDYSLIKDELDSLNKMVEKLQKRDQESEKILNLEMQKTELWKVRAEDITVKYVSVEENRGKRDLMFILMGVGLTVLAGWAVGQASPGR